MSVPAWQEQENVWEVRVSPAGGRRVPRQIYCSVLLGRRRGCGAQLLLLKKKKGMRRRRNNTERLLGARLINVKKKKMDRWYADCESEGDSSESLLPVLEELPPGVGSNCVKKLICPSLAEVRSVRRMQGRCGLQSSMQQR